MPIKINAVHYFDEDITHKYDKKSNSAGNSREQLPPIGDDSKENYQIYDEEQLVTYMIPVSKVGNSKNRSLTPATLAIICTIGTLKLRVLLKVLLDSGSTKTMIHKHALSRGYKPVSLQTQ